MDHLLDIKLLSKLSKCKKVELRSECKYGPKYWDLFSLPEKLKEETLALAKSEQEKLDVVKKQNYELAASLRDKERKILDKLENEKKKFETELQIQKKHVTDDLVYDVVSNMTKIPITKFFLNLIHLIILIN